MLTVGRSAPSFSLPDQDGRSVSLRGLRGRWVVLYFYPKDDTPGCTVEACEFTSLLPDFRDEVHYTYRRHGRPIDKTIVFFVGEVGDWSGIPSDAPTREHGPHPHEGVWFVWGDERDTHRRLFHPGMRELLTRASYFLQAHDRIHGG